MGYILSRVDALAEYVESLGIRLGDHATVTWKDQKVYKDTGVETEDNMGGPIPKTYKDIQVATEVHVGRVVRRMYADKGVEVEGEEFHAASLSLPGGTGNGIQ